jgi:beta-galactosidase
VQLPVALPAVAPPSRAPAGSVRLPLSQTDGRVGVSGDGFSLTFSPEAGLEQVLWRDAPVITAGPKLQIWRAATDNDGIKGLPKRRNNTLGHWLAAGLDQLVIGPATIEASETNDGVAVSLEQVASCAASPTAVAFRHTYRIHPDGRIAVDCAFNVDPALIDLPRLGVTLTLADAFEDLEWFGRGPRETYSDRKRAGWIGRFSGAVSDQYVAYAMPQEHGNKTDLRWMALQSPQILVRFTPSEPCEGSASRYAPRDLFAATHTTDLRPRAEVLVNLDVAQRGLGTGSCGPSTLPQYRIGPGDHRLAFEIAIQDR